MNNKKVCQKKNKHFSLYYLTIVIIPLLLMSKAYAEFDPGVIKTGGVDIVPVVEIAEAYDSNVLYSAADKKSSLLTTIKPQIITRMDVGANKYSLAAGANIGRYADSLADNYRDTNIGLDLHQSFTRKATLDFLAKRTNTHEARGVAYSQGVATSQNLSQLTEPDRYYINRFDSKFSYGSKDAIGKIEFKLFSENREYETRRTITKTRDRDIVGGAATFFYHIMPKTSLLFELGTRELSYLFNETYDSAEKRMLMGTTWDISALTSGTAKAGMLKKDFDSTLRKSSTILSWEVSARWTPLSYSVVDVLTKGKIEETDGNGDYIDSKSIISQWTHFWSANIKTVANINLTKNNYQPAERNDNYLNVGLKVNYDFRRWLNVGLGYTYMRNHSTKANFAYQKNIVSFNVMAAL